MANFTEAVKFEEQAPPGTIRLVQAGEFLRAYNHSAWLFHCCIAKHKVVKKFIKALDQEIYYVGFPFKSLFNNIGDRKSEKTELGFDIKLAEDEIPEDTGYSTWLESVNTEIASASDFVALPLAGIGAEREVIRRLKEFQFERKSMIECVVFLAELRGLLNNK